MPANKVVFFRSINKSGETEYMTARIRLPSGKEFHVGYHPNIGEDGQRDGLNIGLNGYWNDEVFTETVYDPCGSCSWFEDRSADDMFCSEMFQALTGRFPYEVEEAIVGNQDYAEFPH